ncbi:heme-binding beta-barrel domain-containing protein [bacterium]|nr:heme-binding beta-barrel domain-containing protein [bacterium]
MTLDIKNLGPLAVLAGVWEGDKGDDTAPSDDRGVEKNKFRERMVFEPISPVQNHEQMLYGLRYSTVATRVGEVDGFHEEVGYWLWHPSDKQVLRCFTIPRGIALIAGGTVEMDSTIWTLGAKRGSNCYGISSNLFLEAQFQIVQFDQTLTIHDSNCFSYEQNTQIKIAGQDSFFQHIDKNTLKRVSN